MLHLQTLCFLGLVGLSEAHRTDCSCFGLLYKQIMLPKTLHSNDFDTHMLLFGRDGRGWGGGGVGGGRERDRDAEVCSVCVCHTGMLFYVRRICECENTRIDG